MAPGPAGESRHIVDRVHVTFDAQERVGELGVPAARDDLGKDRPGSPGHPAEKGRRRGREGREVESSVDARAENHRRPRRKLPERFPDAGRGEGGTVGADHRNPSRPGPEGRIRSARHPLSEIAPRLRPECVPGERGRVEVAASAPGRVEEVPPDSRQRRHLLRRVREHAGVECDRFPR